MKRRRIIISIFVLIMFFTISNIGYAANTQTDKTKYQVVLPSDPSMSTGEKITLISGRAPEGTNVVIYVYGTTDLTGKNFNLNKLPEENDYILISSETIKAGKLGFAKEVELVNGINQIVAAFEIKGTPQDLRIISVYDTVLAEEAAKNLLLLTK